MAIALPELVAASAVLDPTGKALLNLWLHRDLGDDRIAELIGSTPERVAARRERVLQTLAYQLDTTPENVREAIDHAARAPATAEPATAPEPAESSKPALPAEAAWESEEATTPPPPASPGRPARGRRRSGLAALALLAAIGLIAVLLAATGSGRPEPPHPVRAAAQPEQQPTTQPKISERPKTTAKPKPKPPRAARPKPVRKPAAKTPQVVLKPLPGSPSKARGTVTLESHRGRTFVRLQLTGLPRARGTYRLWLYNSVLDSRALADASPAGKFVGPLPRSSRHFRYLDVSVQDPGSRFHSGQSVLRATLARPRRGP